MRVIPIDAGVGEADAVREGTARRHRRLREVGCAVEPVVESDAVPVYGGRFGQVVAERYDDLRPSRDLDERARILPVETVPGVSLSVQVAANEAGLEPQRAAIVEPQPVPEARGRRRSDRTGRRDL